MFFLLLRSVYPSKRVYPSKEYIIPVLPLYQLPQNKIELCLLQEPYIQACVHFLKRRCPHLLHGGKDDTAALKGTQLLPDTLNTMLGCLQACAK